MPPELLPWSGHPERALQVFAWSGLGAAALLPALARDPSTATAISVTCVLTTLGWLASLLLARLYRYTQPTVTGRSFLVIAAVACYALGNGWSVAEGVSRRMIYSWIEGAPPVFPPTRTFFHNGLLFTSILMTWSLLYTSFKYFAEYQAQAQRLLAADALAKEAQLQALRYQLNPHFLFNALNGLSTLVLERRTDDASRMISTLSDYFRRTLTYAGERRTSLAAEAEFAKRYLHIERFRFEERLSTEFRLDPGSLDARVPPMILQPLLENAIKHGISRLAHGGSIRITSAVKGNWLTVEVRNDAPPPAPYVDVDRPRIGLANASARLHSEYDGNATLTGRPVEGGFEVVLRLPLDTGSVSSACVS